MSLSDAIKRLFNVQTQSGVEPSANHTSMRIVNVDQTATHPIPAPTHQTGKIDWLNVLEIPYERWDVRTPQIKTEVHKMYVSLADFIDQELNAYNTSLWELRNKLNQSYDYYGNILYTIYCIAEGEVTSHYKPSRGYDNNFSYDLLKQRTDEAFCAKVKKYANQYCETLPKPDEETRAAYHLTPNGLEAFWWDMDGIIREKYKINDTQIGLLNRTPSRSTQVLQVTEVRAYVLVQYLSTLAVLRHEFTNTPGWTKKMSRYLGHFLDQKNYYYGNDDVRIIRYILKICEQTVRQNIPYSRLLKTDEEVAHLRRVLPKASSQAVIDSATKLRQVIHLSDNAIELLRKQNPHAWKQDIIALKGEDTNECLKTLNYYCSDEAFNRIAKEAIKYTDDNNPVQLIALYAYYSTLPEGKGDWATRQKLNKLILHPDQQKAFDQLARKSLALDVELVKALHVLTKPPVRTVILDPNKLSVAHGEHEEALKKVSSYLGEDQKPDKPQVSESSKKVINMEDLFGTVQDEGDLALTSDQLEFLKMIVDTDWSLPISQAEVFARSRNKLLRGFVQELNKSVYEHIEDQLITQDDDKITVDETYKSFVKETLNARDTA
ncbi:hypothetical protein BH23PAT2_BH23PAT2_07130 [soil metagenome]